MAEPFAVRQRERDLSARVAKQERAAAARKKAIIDAGGQVLQSNRGPGTLSGVAYDALQRGVEGLSRATGMNERNAAQYGRKVNERLQGATEGLLGLDETERAFQNVGRGNADLGDYINAGLIAAPPLLARPAKAVGRFVAKQVGKRAPKVAKGVKRAADYIMTDQKGPISALEDVVPSDLVAARRPKTRRLPAPAPRAEVPTPRFAALPPAAERPALPAPGPGLPPHAAKPLRITTPDEVDWELPADFDEPVEIVSAPAQPKPPRKKVKAYHATRHRFEPEVKVRNLDDGFEFYRPRPADLSQISPGLEVVKDYPLGRFRLDKMGSGAGAQMYGAGIYAAEAPSVARAYRTDTAVGTPMLGGVDANRAYFDLLEKADKLPIERAQPLYDRASLLEDILHAGDTLDVDEAISRGYAGYTPELIDWYKKKVQGQLDVPGALYELNLDVDPAQMMSWNTPVAEQPYVKNALAPLMQQYGIPEDELYGKYPLTGADLYHGLSFRSDVRPQAMADMLTGAGLSGVRYADVGSGPGGTNTQNYVMMNPDLIDILKRYRAGGAVTKGVY